MSGMSPRSLGYGKPESLRRAVQVLGPVSVVPYSVYVWSSAFLLMTVLAFFSMLMGLFVPFKRFHGWWAAPGMTACITLGGSRIDITYDPAFDPEVRGVFCQNHVNVMDGHLASAVIPHAFCGLQLAWHFKVPGYGWMMKMSGGIPVYPHSEGKTAEISAAARDRVDRGLSILAFPEAHRTKTGKIGKVHRGVFFMARDAGIPVVPMVARGMREINRKGSMQILPGRVEVYVGRQMQTEGLTDDQIYTLAEHVRMVMVAWADEGRTPTDEDYGDWA